VSGAPALVSAQETRPNLLLLLTDQQTHTALSCAGNPWLRTPAMDSLAATGRRFTQAYCNYPVCSPSRGSIFTGRMPHETGVRVNGQAIVAGMPTLGELLRAAGYETVYGGKWHVPKPFGDVQGFSRLIGGSSQGADMDAPLASACANWLRGKPKQPFAMVASFMNPHDICEWIRRHKGMREQPKGVNFPPPPANMAHDPDEPDCMRYHRTAGYDKMSEAVGIAQQWRREDMRLYLHDYYRMVEKVDREMGRVLTALRESGLDRNTLVAFASDHGEGMGAHRWVQKAAFYEESVHVPLILNGPGVEPGVDHNLVTLADLLPTFCEAAGVAVPKDLAGASLFGPRERKFVVSELRYGDASREGRMLRTKRYKYVVFNTGARREQFFDLELDPGESFNLAGRSEARGLVGEHRQLMKDWISSRSDDFRLA